MWQPGGEGGEFGGVDTCVCIAEQLSPFAVHLKLPQHGLFISYTQIQNKKLKKSCTWHAGQ